MENESESLNCEIEQNAWEELRRTMECLSDQPLQIIFISIQSTVVNFIPFKLRHLH